MKTLLLAAGAALLVSPTASAAPSFDEMTIKLQRILQCDPMEFPRSKKQSDELAVFQKQLQLAGARKRVVGDGSAKEMISYQLPNAVTVFGQKVNMIDNFDAPLVSITFPIAGGSLTKLIAQATGTQLVYDKASRMYAQKVMNRSMVEGSLFPTEHGITITDIGKRSATYVCNAHSTDPNVGG